MSVVWVWRTDNVVVTGFTIRGERANYGIWLDNSNNCTLIGNTATNIGVDGYGDGICLKNSNNCTLIRNTATSNGEHGISLERSDNCTLVGNTARDNPSNGIKLTVACYNTFTNNSVSNNHYDGIWITASSNSNTFVGNTVTSNTPNGIRVHSSSSNSIFHNNFVGNAEQVRSDGSTNVWDDGYPSGGNYWSDYESEYPNAEEIDDSGIWDTPYEITENNQDNYPLMNLWGVPPPLDTTPPTISIISPENKTYAVSDVPLTFTVNESTSWIGYSLDGQSNVTITGNTTLPGLSDGTYSLVVYAKDLIGNEGSSEMVYFTIQSPVIDATPPVILVTSPENKTYATADISLICAVDESVSWMAYSLDGQANTTVTGDITLSGLSDGPHSLVVYARDNAGNTGASGTVSFTIETPAEPPPAEPFPLWIIAVIAIVGGAVTAFLVLSRRSKKPTEKIK